MTAEQRRARAYAAKALLDDATIQDGWALIEADLIEEWAKPQPWGDERAVVRREAIYIELQTLRKLRQRLANFAGQARD